jgi:Na+/melibiose symporter-like transporter
MELDDVLPCRKFAFSIGHFLNDLCASVWFSYSLVFYHRIAKFSNSSAGYLLLIGQVADAFSTTFVGFASDRTKHGFCGKRKSWHLLGLSTSIDCFSFRNDIFVGVICVLCSFPFCFQLQTFSSFISYTIFIIIFQFGWACSQIGHLSMLNELTPKDGERVALNAYRHAWSIVANIFVYGITWLLLDNNQTNDNAQMNANVFRVREFLFKILLKIIICRH